MQQPYQKPDPGQESVWDYPRPPRVEDTGKLIQVIFHGKTIAQTRRAKRVLETSHPPAYYIPPEDVHMEYLEHAPGASYCEWKGIAHYYSVVVDGKRAPSAAWVYANPSPGFESIRGYLAFYARQMDVCLVDGEPVQPQPGNFYGGWITSDIVGPFKS